MASILLIDDEVALTNFVHRELERLGHKVECLDCAEYGLDRLTEAKFDVVVLDNMMPRITGLEFLAALRGGGNQMPVILMTGAPSSSIAITAARLGAFKYVIKPNNYQALVPSLLLKIEQVVQAARQQNPAAEPRPEPTVPAEPELVGSSEPMQAVYTSIGLFAVGINTILIRGETGTGKELVARAVHNASPRKDNPFVALNCGALNENLLESELFGHEKGAFTNADKRRIGRFEQAHQGTLFLDEIGDVPMSMQIKLLRVLQKQQFERVGGTEPIDVNVRVVAATHQDMEKMVQEGKFREDLYYRLNVARIDLPPLRDRLDDLPELVNGFVARAAAESHRPRPTVTAETLDRLRDHPRRWPGNVRELENVIHRAIPLCRGSQLLPEHIDFSTTAAKLAGTVAPTGKAEAIAGLQKAIEWAWATNQEKLWPLLRDLLEEELLKVALDRLQGNKAQISDRLDMALNTLRKRMEEYKLKEDRG